MARISVTSMLMVLALSTLCADALAFSCCRKYTQRKINNISMIRGFSIQSMRENCHIDAVILHARRGLNICADPSKPWVTEIISQLRKKVEEIKKKHKN
ncbi:C-C motif chemokine 20a.3 [Misgurnus anguillicaudatus]|uniref:C-C motif chemokine 20a.3 n=1 Tax=Misgurnus anguillicaudatus TaxID=75329 RepID=UPI002435CE06|nr:C-C motif chemokine 20a.3 [Misgurnus anguillicaudatus]